MGYTPDDFVPGTATAPPPPPPPVEEVPQPPPDEAPPVEATQPAPQVASNGYVPDDFVPGPAAAAPAPAPPPPPTTSDQTYGSGTPEERRAAYEAANPDQTLLVNTSEEPVPEPSPDTGETIANQGVSGDYEGVWNETPGAPPEDLVTQPGPVKEQLSPEGQAAYEAATNAPPPPPPPGPLEQAIFGASDKLGEVTAPITSHLPEGARNVGDAIGQAASGYLDEVTDVTAELGQGDLPGATGEFFDILSGPQQRGVEELENRIYQGLPAVPHNEALTNPGSTLAILPGLVS